MKLCGIRSVVQPHTKSDWDFVLPGRPTQLESQRDSSSSAVPLGLAWALRSTRPIAPLALARMASSESDKAPDQQPLRPSETLGDASIPKEIVVGPFCIAVK